MMREDLRRRIWPIALALIGFFFAFPVLALIKLEDHVNSLNQGLDSLVSLQHSFTVYTLGPNNGFAIAGLMIMAVLNAIHGMKYLHNRQEADFYGSIPVLRTTKFNAAFVNGILIALLPYILMQILAVMIGASRGFITGEGILFTVETLVLETVGFLIIYTVIVLACVLTGHTAVAVAAGGVLSFALPSYMVLIEAYKSMFFITLYEETMNKTWYLCPFTLFMNILVSKTDGGLSQTGYHLKNVLTAAVTLVISIVIYLITNKLVKIRPAEAAGKSMSFEKTKPFIKVIIMIPVAMTFGAFFPSFTNGSTTYPWLVFGLIVGIILGHAVIEIIYEFDFKACMHHIPSGLVAAVITAAVALFFVFDFTGYDTKLPDRDKTVSAAVFIPGIENGMYGRGYALYGEESYYMSDSDICMSNMNLTDIDDVYVLARAGCDYAKKYRWHGSAPDKNIDYEDNPGYNQISLTLRNASGHEYKRSYYIDTKDAEIFDALSRIYSTEAFRKNTYEVLADTDKLQDADVNIIRYDSSGYTETADSVSRKDTKRLVEAMTKETEALTLDYLREEAPIGYLEFELKPGITPEEDITYYDTNRPVGYLYPSYTETLSILKDLGIDVRERNDPGNVDYVLKLIYDDDGNDISERISDRAEIEKLFPDLVNQDYAAVNYAVFEAIHVPSYEVHYKPASIREEYEGSNVEFCVQKVKPEG